MSKYPSEQIDDMRHQLCDVEYMCLKDKDILEILLNGCEGYISIDDGEIIERYKEHFGEYEDDSHSSMPNNEYAI